MLIKFAKYLLILLNEVEENKISGGKYKSIKKIRNKIVKISAKVKS